MATSRMSEAVQHLRRGMLLREGAGLTDGQLLGCFVEHRDGDAFAALVRRHGPMVWGVCRRLLGHHDAEDAFQAAFLVLSRKAASVRPREMVANWLYGVAHQAALQARRTTARRRAREKQVADVPEPAVAGQDLRDDLRPLLDRELSRLPDRLRVLVVLCDLQGKTRKEAARQLGLPEGTVGSRLMRARAMLAKRLTRRGVALSGGALAAVLSGKASAGVPASVVSSTIKAATLDAAGRAAAGAISVELAALREGVLKAMSFTRRKFILVLIVVAALSGAAGLIYRTGAAEPPETQAAAGKGGRQKPPPKGRKPKPDEEQLRGTWRLVAGAEDGKRAKVEDGDLDAVLTVRGETLHLRVTGRKDGMPVTDRFFVLRLDPTATPKLIDLADWQKGFEGNNEVIEGVYALDGDSFTICLGFGALGENRGVKNRPTDLEPKEGSRTTAWTFKRGAGARKQLPPPPAGGP